MGFLDLPFCWLNGEIIITYSKADGLVVLLWQSRERYFLFLRDDLGILLRILLKYFFKFLVVKVVLTDFLKNFKRRLFSQV